MLYIYRANGESQACSASWSYLYIYKYVIGMCAAAAKFKIKRKMMNVNDKCLSWWKIGRFSEDELYGEPMDGAWRHLQLTEDSDPSSVFDSVFMSMSDTLNSINTLASSDQTPEDRPLNTNLITTPSRDTPRYAMYTESHAYTILISLYSSRSHLYFDSLFYRQFFRTPAISFFFCFASKHSCFHYLLNHPSRIPGIFFYLLWI